MAVSYTHLDVYKRQAYDNAVEVVTDTVRQETHKEDIRLLEESKKWVLSPERKAPKKERDYAAARLDGVITKIKRVMPVSYTHLGAVLSAPVRQECVAGQAVHEAAHTAEPGCDQSGDRKDWHQGF